MATGPERNSLLIVLVSYLIGCLPGLIFGLYVLVKTMIIGPKKMFYPVKRSVRPDELYGTEYGTHEFLRLKNSMVTLHYVISGPKDKPLMVFVHGFPEFWYSWRHQIKEFCNDYRVVALDLRGYGESSKPSDLDEYVGDQYINDLHELITSLGYEKCILVSHDFGATIAYMFAHRHPDMVEKLVACSGLHPAAFEDYWKLKPVHMLTRFWHVFFFHLPILPIIKSGSDDSHTLIEIYRGPQWGMRPGVFTDEVLEMYKHAYATNDDWKAAVYVFGAHVFLQAGAGQL